MAHVDRKPPEDKKRSKINKYMLFSVFTDKNMPIKLLFRTS